ncbi:hypothetical protein G3I60_02880 [Streptomyces sp. SID13666]|uniref:hypothetical protein n=1 Tax=unclassified Streptomyces TaxID=2593676 RepID=UPI0013C23B55|nr:MULTISPECIES: hypothetical protein [unclassified Streptomyces]NEA53144.1 hypothetical protein [Streptomyces sp. SID13666]NEA69529.1 hypothetical protein [Streptomyces sp. SID13588]
MIDFELVVPHGWVQIPTTPDTTALRRRIIEDVIRHHLPDSLPRDKAGPWRRMLRKELIEATDEAARQSARSVLLPLEEFSGVRLPGSMLVTVLEGEDEAEDPERLLASILADAGAEGSYREIGGAPAVRVASVVDSGRVGRRAPSWRVSYYVSHPDAPGTWGLLTFTVLTDGDVDAEPVQAVVLLFDMIVTTLRWADRIDVPTEDEVLAQLAELSAAGSPAAGTDAGTTSAADMKKV